MALSEISLGAIFRDPLNISVWLTLQQVLNCDSVKTLFFQKFPGQPEPKPAEPATQKPGTKSGDVTGSFIFWGFGMFTICFHETLPNLQTCHVLIFFLIC